MEPQHSNAGKWKHPFPPRPHLEPTAAHLLSSATSHHFLIQSRLPVSTEAIITLHTISKSPRPMTSVCSHFVYQPAHSRGKKRWVYFVSGLAYITLPTNDVSVYVTGEYGLIFAADTAGASILGHRTQYLGTTETVSIAMPTKDGSIPAHILLHYGPCAQRDFAGYDDLVGIDSEFISPYTGL